jgi:chorismate mutase/prephenate dehydratase
MAKRKSSSKSTPKTPAATLKQLESNAADLVKLLSKHAKLTETLTKQTAQEGRLKVDLHTERQVMDKAVEASDGTLPEHVVRGVMRELASGSRARIKQLKVAYLGPLYSYSYLAAVERFGQSAELSPVGNISAVFEEVDRHQAQFGIVPIENTTDGRVVDTLDMFSRLPVRICGEVQLRIHHYLLGKGQRAEVTEVYSKPQALSQCRGWLAKHLPGARLVEMTSTAAAAQLAADKPGAAAVASRQAGVNFGLNVLADNIEDNSRNITRFAIIGESPSKRTGRDKTSLMFEISHAPGALADAMGAFKRAGVNMTWIESFPMANVADEYLFFVELEGHESEAKVKRALEGLGRKAVKVTVLGSYERCEPVE